MYTYGIPNGVHNCEVLNNSSVSAVNSVFQVVNKIMSKVCFEFYESYSEDSVAKKVSTVCKECKKEIKGQVSVTSNFVTLKVNSNTVKSMNFIERNIERCMNLQRLNFVSNLHAAIIFLCNTLTPQIKGIPSVTNVM